MKLRRLPWGVVVPVFLVGLVAVLAGLQYRWLGQVSEAEREQLRRSFNQRARDFSSAFDLEISRACATLQLSPGAVAARDWGAFASAVDRWHETAPFPQMIRAIYLAEQAGDEWTLRPYSSADREFRDKPEKNWPTSLEPVRRQLAASGAPEHPAPAGIDMLRLESPQDSASRVFTIGLASVNVDVPALIIPLSAGPMEPLARTAGTGSGIQTARQPATPQAAFVWVQEKNAHVIVELDGAFLRETVLPALADIHLPGPGADTYRFAVQSASEATLFSGGLQDGTSIAADRADVVMPLLTFRPDLARGFMTGANRPAAATRSAPQETQPGPGAGATPFEGRMSVLIVTDTDGRAQQAGGGSTQIRLARPAWRLVLQHGAGSLDAAVTQARQRNLALSFGILAVLSIGIALVVINARRSEQLAAKQMEFVATVSHELRTPLTVIRSAAQNLSAGVIADPGQTRRYGELIDKEGRRLTDMVEQVLDYAGLTGNRALRLTQLTDAGALVNDVMTSCSAVVEQAGCEAEIAVEDGLFVMADQDALRRAVENLVTNAVKHAAGGRWVGVTAKAGPDGARPEVIISVGDRGPGIPANEIPHIFDAFYRGRHATDQQVRGNGLGLSLVRRIVAAHGGSVTVRSAAGEGTTFTMVLPAAGDAPAAGTEPGPPA